MTGFGHNDFCQQVPDIIGAHGPAFVTSQGTVIDLMTSTSCVGLGYGSEVQRRILNNALSVPFGAYDYPTVWRQSAEVALDMLHPDYEFAFFSGGAEAVEAAIRIAKSLTGSSNPGRVGGFTTCFHGKTYLTGLLTDGRTTPLTKIYTYDQIPISPTDGEDTDDVFAMVVEPFQCRNGVNVPRAEFLKELQLYCRERQIILIDDEISCSLRSGYALTMSAMVPDWRPEIITLGKNYGQGIPVSLVGVRRDLVEHVGTSCTSGFGGNPLACIAVAESVGYMVEESVLSANRVNGRWFLSDLRSAVVDCDLVQSVSGFGMWFGVALQTPEIATFVASHLLEHKWLVGLVGRNIRLAPPFNLGREMWQRFTTQLRGVLDDYESSSLER